MEVLFRTMKLCRAQLTALSIYLSIYLSICLSINSDGVSFVLSFFLSIYLSIYLSIQMVFLSFFLSFFLSIYLSIYLSIQMVFLSFFLSIWRSPRGALANVLDCYTIVHEFELQLRYYDHLLIPLGKAWTPLSPPQH